MDRLNFAAVTSAGLGALCSAAFVAAAGPWHWLPLLPCSVCLATTIAVTSRNRRRDRKLLAELQEHQAAFGAAAATVDSVPAAARAMVDAAERAVARSAAQVAELETQLAAHLSAQSRRPALTDAPEFPNAFVTKVSHELRTPLAGIKACAELLVDGEARDDRARLEFYEVIQSEADRLSRLVDDILSTSRIEAGAAGAPKRPVEIRDLVARALARVTPDAERKRLEISLANASSDYQTPGDSDLLEQALVILLDNAIRFSPAGSVINVRTDTNPHENTVLIRIHHHRPAVDPKDVSGMFDKSGGAQTCARTAGGTGVGLALVRQIIQTVHGGSVFADVVEEAGNCFGFELELCPPESSRTPRPGEVGIQ
jgi:K+-sensing histidine kinase KdpD